MMKWGIFFATILFDVLAVKYIAFMHNNTAIIAFLGVSLFAGLIVQESREDLPGRSKKIISGFMLGTYAAVAIISFLVYQKYILI